MSERTGGPWTSDSPHHAPINREVKHSAPQGCRSFRQNEAPGSRPRPDLGKVAAFRGPAPRCVRSAQPTKRSSGGRLPLTTPPAVGRCVRPRSRGISLRPRRPRGRVSASSRRRANSTRRTNRWHHELTGHITEPKAPKLRRSRERYWAAYRGPRVDDDNRQRMAAKPWFADAKSRSGPD